MSMTRDVHRRLLLEKVFPKIRECWPGGTPGYTIWLQQDNAPPTSSLMTLRCGVLVERVAGTSGW